MEMDIRLPGEAHPAMDLQTIAGIMDSGLIGEELGGSFLGGIDIYSPNSSRR